MSTHGMRHTLVTAAIALAVGLVGGALWEHDVGVYVGALVGAGIQIMGWFAAHAIYPGRRFPAYLLGMVVRVAALGLIALAWIPWLGIPAAPVLLTVVTVFFLTTLVEPVFVDITFST